MRVQLSNYVPAVAKMSLELEWLWPRSFQVRSEGLAFEICGEERKARHTQEAGDVLLFESFKPGLEK